MTSKHCDKLNGTMLPPEKRRQTSFNNKQQLHEKKSIAVKVRNKTKNHNLLECGHCKGFYAKDYFKKNGEMKMN